MATLEQKKKHKEINIRAKGHLKALDKCLDELKAEGGISPIKYKFLKAINNQSLSEADVILKEGAL